MAPGLDLLPPGPSPSKYDTPTARIGRGAEPIIHHEQGETPVRATDRARRVRQFIADQRTHLRSVGIEDDDANDEMAVALRDIEWLLKKRGCEATPVPAGHIVIPAPTFAHKASGETDADLARETADRIYGNVLPGSNCCDAAARLLYAAASAMDGNR